MMSVKEVTDSVTAYHAKLKESDRDRVAQRTEQAVAENPEPQAAARAIADVVSEVSTQDSRNLAPAHRVAAETVADVAPERAEAVTAALSQQLAGAYTGASTSTLDTAA